MNVLAISESTSSEYHNECVSLRTCADPEVGGGGGGGGG